MTEVPDTSQAWFWEPEWSAGEREASAQIEAGDLEEFEDVESLFAALDRTRRVD